jgi:serine protease Do
MKLSRPVGALVNDVSPGGAAAKAGIKPGDIILAFDDLPIETSGDLPPIVGANPPGTEAKVLVSRDGKEMTFDVTLDALEPGSGEQALAGEGAARQSNAIGRVAALARTSGVLWVLPRVESSFPRLKAMQPTARACAREMSSS